MSRISVLPNDRTSRPSKSICPEVGSVRRNKQRPTVDFPQPDSPTSPSVSPAKISNETPSTARTTSSLPSTGKCLTSPRTFTSCSITLIRRLRRLHRFDSESVKLCYCPFAQRRLAPRLFLPLSRTALICGICVICGFRFVVGSDCRSQIEQNASHLRTTPKLIQRYFLFRTTRNVVRTTRSEVSSRRQCGGTGDHAFNRFQSFLLHHFSSC